MEIHALFDDRTSTLTYIASDPESRDTVVIDPVMDYDPAAGSTWRASVERVIEYLNQHQLKLRAVLETHAHADHLSGSQLLKEICPAHLLAIGDRITEVQQTFRPVFALPESFPVDGRQFDRLLKDGEILHAGTLRIETLATPGHTPACVTYKIGTALFTGDALFMPDSGTGRCDFPGGSALALYRSITQRIYSQPEDTRIFVGHDYQPGGRPLSYETTVGEERRSNIALNANTTEADFVAFREKRDSNLPAPRLLFQSVQVNIDGGRLPTPVNGAQFLRMPLNAFRPAAPQAPITLETCEAARPGGRQG